MLVIRAQCDYGPVVGTAWIPKGITDGETAEHTVPWAAEPRTANALKGHRLLKNHPIQPLPDVKLYLNTRYKQNWNSLPNS